MTLRDGAYVYDQIWMEPWQCTIKNDIYYIRLDTQYTTRTAIFTCLSLTPDEAGCQNGGFPDGTGNCTCPPGFEGDNCNKILCYNGGEPTDSNTCTCDPLYTGPHCDTVTFSCQKQPEEPVYSSLLDTLILVIDKSTAGKENIISTLQKSIKNIPTVFQQFILVVYYASPTSGDGKNEVLYNL